MSASDMVAVILAAVALVSVAALALVCGRLARLSRELAEAVAEVSTSVPAATRELVEAARIAGDQVDRLEALIQTTGSIAGTVDTATQATLRAISSPVIKGAALATGTTRAARRLRGRGSGEQEV
jgi:hypothetical protein